MGNDGEDSYQIRILAIIVKFLLSIGHLHPHKYVVVAKIWGFMSLKCESKFAKTNMYIWFWKLKKVLLKRSGFDH